MHADGWSDSFTDGWSDSCADGWSDRCADRSSSRSAKPVVNSEVWQITDQLPVYL